MDNPSKPTIEELFPHLTEIELAQAEANLDRYLTLVLRIFTRIEGRDVPPRG